MRAIWLAAIFAIAKPALSADINSSLIVAPNILEVRAGTVRLMELGIAPAATVPKSAMLLIQGLPRTSVLTTGRLFESGIWAVRFTDLDKLALETTPDLTARMPIALSIVTLDGKVLAERSMMLSIVAAASLPDGAASSAEATTQAIGPTASLPSPQPVEGMEDVNVLMARGEENLLRGKIQVARLFYRRAAEQGLADGAIALAETYDPYELVLLNALGGVQPDLALARVWYEKARALGSTRAAGRLSRLDAHKK